MKNTLDISVNQKLRHNNAITAIYSSQNTAMFVKEGARVDSRGMWWEIG